MISGGHLHVHKFKHLHGPSRKLSGDDRLSRNYKKEATLYNNDRRVRLGVDGYIYTVTPMLLETRLQVPDKPMDNCFETAFWVYRILQVDSTSNSIHKSGPIVLPFDSRCTTDIDQAWEWAQVDIDSYICKMFVPADCKYHLYSDDSCMIIPPGIYWPSIRYNVFGDDGNMFTVWVGNLYPIQQEDAIQYMIERN